MPRDERAYESGRRAGRRIAQILSVVVVLCACAIVIHFTARAIGLL